MERGDIAILSDSHDFSRQIKKLLSLLDTSASMSVMLLGGIRRCNTLQLVPKPQSFSAYNRSTTPAPFQLEIDDADHSSCYQFWLQP
jgi:hypothetical protein